MGRGAIERKKDREGGMGEHKAGRRGKLVLVKIDVPGTITDLHVSAITCRMRCNKMIN